jgi:hypothetical protein
MSKKNAFFASALALGCTGLLWVQSSFAIVQPEDSGAKRLIFKQPELEISELNQQLSQLAENGERTRAQTLGASAENSHVDVRTGRFATLMPGVSLLPGRGHGNTLTWNKLGAGAPATVSELEQRAWGALRGWLAANGSALRIDAQELGDARVTVLGPEFIQIYVPRRIAGLAVRDAHLMATIKYGNLILFSAKNWGDIDTTPVAQLGEPEARAALSHHVAPFELGQWKSSELVWVPVASAGSHAQADYGRGLEHRLAWLVRPTFGEENGRYEALIDAVDGRVLAVEDMLHHVAVTRNVEGGVFPVSNDNVNPDGVEQADSPMLFSTLTIPGGSMDTDVGGNLPVCVDGTVTHNLTGPYMQMSDSCGAASLSGTGNLDWGASAGTDCTTPGVGGAGNTHASRTGFFELNQIKAMARSQLPNNSWLKDRLTSNMNIVTTCNAFWNGATVNFYRSGGGCNNTGELAGVFDHEWGHGMDNNDAVPSVSSPGEGIADVYASLRLDDSCIGRNFRASNCGGYGNPCTQCTGIREIDWAKHTANAAFTMTNADACTFNPNGSNGPCGGSSHCEGQIYSQAVWDLWNRDLVGAPFNRTLDVAREIATQLTYRGASGVSAWYSCTPNTSGCSNAAGCGCVATSGYMQYLSADDDNGNLNDGTPNMQAIFNAFSRHGIACTTPTVTTAGCSGAPTQVPVVTATNRDRAVSLSWTASAGATNYRIYRGTGVFACSFGKELVATVTGTTYVDLGLKNGYNYYYQVVPMGAADECFSVSSTCTTGTPTAGANFGFLTPSASIVNGDGDPFIDNCETARVTIPISNIGTGTQTNVRIVGVSSPSHGGGVTYTTNFPSTVSASLSACGSVDATFDFIGATLSQGQTLTFEVELTSDQLSPLTRTTTVSINTLESDFQNFATKTFNYDTNTELWTTFQGTFVRDNTGGGASGTTHYMRSSTGLDSQCDVVRSPVIRLAANSTMNLFNNFDIEAFSSNWWDRANVSIRPLGSATRTVVTPNAGRTYNASGTGGVCGLDQQGGWAGSSPTWASSSWDATALQSGSFAGQAMQLEVRYATDGSANGTGFKFDQVSLTNVDVQVADSLSNVCAGEIPLFADGFETAGTGAWDNTVP